jgi:hypothetical protein
MGFWRTGVGYGVVYRLSSIEAEVAVVACRGRRLWVQELDSALRVVVTRLAGRQSVGGSIVCLGRRMPNVVE